MSELTTTGLERFDSDWPASLAMLAGEMHAVDRDACSIWFQFFPLSLHGLVQSASDSAAFRLFYQLKGEYHLSKVADTSHKFLYGHRYWPAIKEALRKVTLEKTLAATIRSIASEVQSPLELTLPIAAIGLMTLRQVGLKFLDQSYQPAPDKETADEWMSHRTGNAKRTWLRKPPLRIVIDEHRVDGWFPVLPGQHLTTAAERDKRPHYEGDSRCSIGNGSIPVDCRSGSCGTCWVGILAGNEMLDAVEPFERKRMEYFGYWENPFHDRESPRPLIRLACQTVARGTCSIVIPPWNGVWGLTRRAAAGNLQDR